MPARTHARSHARARVRRRAGAKRRALNAPRGRAAARCSPCPAPPLQLASLRRGAAQPLLRDTPPPPGPRGLPRHSCPPDGGRPARPAGGCGCGSQVRDWRAGPRPSVRRQEALPASGGLDLSDHPPFTCQRENSVSLLLHRPAGRGLDGPGGEDEESEPFPSVELTRSPGRGAPGETPRTRLC